MNFKTTSLCKLSLGTASSGDTFLLHCCIHPWKTWVAHLLLCLVFLGTMPFPASSNTFFYRWSKSLVGVANVLQWLVQWRTSQWETQLPLFSRRNITQAWVWLGRNSSLNKFQVRTQASNCVAQQQDSWNPFMLFKLKAWLYYTQ